jgi:alanyl-tRNA synthetase
MFKGGLADASREAIQLHTATHLLHAALRKVLGESVKQKGSNITAERLRFDFSHKQKLSEKELKKVENLINQKIKEGLPVHKSIETKEEALKSGALAFFKETYPEKVSVYTIGKDSQKDWVSKELCGGPHVKSTSEIGRVNITKQDKIGSGLIRVYAVAEKN